MSARAAAVAQDNRSIEASQERAIVARAAEAKPRNALEALAQRLNVSSSSLQETLMNTAFKGCSKAEFIALVIVSNTYELNPLLREIYAFPKKGGGIQAIVGYDGWIKIANSHPQFDGLEFIHIEDDNGNVKAVEGILYRKDRNHPTKKLVYLKEFKRNTDPWNNSPNHMLDVRCFCHTVRLGLGVSLGVEGDENLDIDDGSVRAVTVLPSRRSIAEQLDDEIPNFDKAEVVDEQTGEVVQTDSRGMSEVDEETARQLDANDGTLSDDNPTAAEGPADEQRGERHNGDQQAVAAQTIKDIDGPLEHDIEAEPPYLAGVRALRSKLANAKSAKAVDAIDREWCNALRGQVEAADEGLLRSVDKDIISRKRELKAQEG